jgi:uncharacterized protein (TIGR02466 family)
MLPDATSLNADLRQVIDARRAVDPGVRKSNWNGWQSNMDMLDWGGPSAHHLAEHFLKLCDNFTAMPATAAPQFLWSVEMWANVSGRGAANEAHVHPGSVWSAVYYVEDGYGGASGADLGGELTLYDPRMPFVRMLPFDLRYRGADGRAAESQTAVRPVTGQLVMFPPWLFHSVHPYYGEGDRTSIAMNATAIANPAR